MIKRAELSQSRLSSALLIRITSFLGGPLFDLKIGSAAIYPPAHQAWNVTQTYPSSGEVPQDTTHLPPIAVPTAPTGPNYQYQATSTSLPYPPAGNVPYGQGYLDAKATVDLCWENHPILFRLIDVDKFL